MKTIYTTRTCGKCKILKQMMDVNKIEYEECMDTDIMVSKGIFEVPMLETEEGVMMNFDTAILYCKGE